MSDFSGIVDPGFAITFAHWFPVKMKVMKLILQITFAMLFLQMHGFLKFIIADCLDTSKQTFKLRQGLNSYSSLLYLWLMAEGLSEKSPI